MEDALPRGFLLDGMAMNVFEFDQFKECFDLTVSQVLLPLSLRLLGVTAHKAASGKRQLPLLTRPERMRQVGQVPAPPSTLPAEATCLCHPTLELGTLTTPYLSNLESACSFPIFLNPQLQTLPCLVILRARVLETQHTPSPDL
jgi:hypothetical protein